MATLLAACDVAAYCKRSTDVPLVVSVFAEGTPHSPGTPDLSEDLARHEENGEHMNGKQWAIYIGHKVLIFLGWYAQFTWEWTKRTVRVMLRWVFQGRITRRFH